MRIVWINHRDTENPTAGGAERTLYEVGCRLARRGHEVEVLSGSWRGAPAHATYGGLTIRRMPGQLAPHLVVPWLIDRVLRPDVVIEDLAHVLPWLTPWFSDRPCTAFFRHLHRRTLPGQVSAPAASVLSAVESLYPRVFRGTPFVVESAQSEQDLVDLGLPTERITRIPPGVDAGYFHDGPKADRPLFIYFGGMRHYKRPSHAVEAFVLAARRMETAQLLVLGRGPALEQARWVAERSPVSNRIRFLGTVPRETLRDLLASAWVNIHSSLAEGWGYSILEASAAGVPTAAYAVPGVSEVVTDGLNGSLAPSGDVRALSEVMQDLAYNRGPYGASARGWASGFSWENTARAWERHLVQVIGARTNEGDGEGQWT